MTVFSANNTLCNDVQDECKRTVKKEYKCEYVKLKRHPTEEEHKNIIDEIFIKRASLSQIVKRHMFYKKF